MERLKGLPCSGPIAVCNEEHRFLAGEQMLEMGVKDLSIILEPAPKNTAPAIALAAIHAITQGSAEGKDDDPILLVLPADHVIADEGSFSKAVGKALPAARRGRLVTFGIVPERPETGYGYIERGKGHQDDGNIYEVASFREKPDEETARGYIVSGKYYWNSGMFLFRAETYLEELQRHAPEVYETCTKAMQKAEKDLDFIRMETEAFALSPSISIDYAVMEKTDLASVVPLDAGWSDMGSWSALWEVCEKNTENNSILGDVKTIETEDCLIRAENRLVATIGVKDLVVVETKDAVLVAHKDQVQKVKDLVEEIRQNGRHEHLNQREVFRPWGSYDSLETGDRFQVKRIRVKPGAGLSLQMHHHRAEHWIVVKGSAKVTIDGETVFLTENESTFIPVGKSHRLENPGKIPLELIEVQSGSYLGEDDIVRLEDSYGRNTTQK
jgi:mannose-1-phosphate guanylyltransferase